MGERRDLQPTAPFNPSRKICGFYPPEIVNRQRKLLGADGKLHRVTAGQKQLYDRCVRWTGEKVRFWRGFVSIAESLGCSVRQIKRDMAALESFALIRHRRRQRETNVYEFLWHPIFKVQPIAHQEGDLEVTDMAHQDTVLEVTYPVKKGPLDVPTVARQLRQEENHVKGNTPQTPQRPPSQKQPKLPGLCASADARGGESALAKIPRSGNAHPREWFAAWWAIYWRKVAKKAAERAFKKHVRTEERFQQVMSATRAQTSMMMARDPDKRPHAATWINGERWNDEPSAPAIARKPPQSSLGERVKARWAKRLAKGERPI
jgi:hypothetical protein